MRASRINRWSRTSAVAVTCIVGAAAIGVSAMDVSREKKLAQINHFVVFYQENHSFDNLFGQWEGVDGLDGADSAHTTQVDRTGAVYRCLKQNDPSLASPPLAVSCFDT